MADWAAHYAHYNPHFQLLFDRIIVRVVCPDAPVARLLAPSGGIFGRALRTACCGVLHAIISPPTHGQPTHFAP
jgi:hypothetical protein